MKTQTQISNVLKSIGTYKVLEVIGRHESNGQGEIYICLSPQDKMYAIKIIKQNQSQQNTYLSTKSLQEQSAILKNIDHPNIVRFIDKGSAFLQFQFDRKSQNEYPFLVLQFAQYGDMNKFINQTRINQKSKSNSIFLSQPEIIKIALQLLDALEYLHQNKLLHLDIKPKNILVFQNNVFKLADFGHCANFGYFQSDKSQLKYQFGTKFYWPPQLININQKIPLNGQKIDLFNLGITILQLFIPRPIGTNSLNSYRLQKISEIEQQNGNFWRPLLKMRRERGLNSSQLFKKALIGMIHPNPQKRLSIENIRQKFLEAMDSLPTTENKFQDSKFTKKVKMNQNVQQELRNQTQFLQNPVTLYNKTRGTNKNYLSALYQKFQLQLQKLDIKSSTIITDIQYFNLRPEIILAFLQTGLQIYQSKQQSGKSYNVGVTNAKEGRFKVVCKQRDEEQNEQVDQIQGQIVKIDTKDGQNYGILWKYEEYENYKLDYVNKFTSILSIIQSK